MRLTEPLFCCGVSHCLESSSESGSFSLPWSFVSIAPEGGASLGGELRVAAFDEVAGFGDDVLQDFENLAHTGFPVDEFGC